MRTARKTVTIPSALHARAKSAAASIGIKLESLSADAVESYLNHLAAKRSKKRATKATA
jgi:hypothetical protein